jgi:hypothetical protein
MKHLTFKQKHDDGIATARILIIEGEDGKIIVSHPECVHHIQLATEQIEFDVAIETKRNGKRYLRWGTMVADNLQDLLKRCKVREAVPATDIHLWGGTKQRMIDNYRILQHSAEDIGAGKLPEWGK